MFVKSEIRLDRLCLVVDYGVLTIREHVTENHIEKPE